MFSNKRVDRLEVVIDALLTLLDRHGVVTEAQLVEQIFDSASKRGKKINASDVIAEQFGVENE